MSIDYEKANSLADRTHKMRLDWIDALRGYAIFAVIAYHVYQMLPDLSLGIQKVLDFASMGVQLFFMVSAFTIFLTLDEAKKTNPPSYRNFRDFYIRRAFRIMPLFYLTLLVNIFLGRNRPEGFPYREFFSTLTFTSAWIPSLCPTLVAGGWSIAVEMWFYLLAPLLVYMIRSFRHALYFTLATLSLRFCINEGLSRFIESKPRLFSAFIYFWLPNQLPLFALGILIFFLYKKWRKDDQIMGVATMPQIGRSYALFFLLSGGYLLIASVQGFKALLPFHFLFGLSFLLITLHMLMKPSSFLVNRPLMGLGKISYSAYISHFFIIRYTHNWFLTVIGSMSRSSVFQAVAFLVWTLFLTVLASLFLYRIVERPGQNLGKRFTQRYLPGLGIASPWLRSKCPLNLI